MVILGLGSNLHDRLHYFRQALKLIKQIPCCFIKQISPLYISDALLPENAPKQWDMPHLNLAIRCETNLTPDEFLEHTKRIEKTVGRTPQKTWGPRVIDIDILAWDDLVRIDEKLHIPHEGLTERPFALWPLADVAPFWVHPLKNKTAQELVLPWGSRFDGNAPLHTKQIQHRIDTPQLVGILNVTPDSFSDGGQFFNLDHALQQFMELVNAGAEIIDIGAEATGPTANELTPDLEWERLEPLLDFILPTVSQMMIPPKISIDTRHYQVAKKCLDRQVNWINDVSGLEHPEMQEIIAEYNNDVVIMHHLFIPENRQITLPLDQDVPALIYDWAEKKLTLLEKKGIARERIIVDVGIGYGKTAEQSLSLIKNISSFQKLNTRLLLGHSRKSFLQQFISVPPADRDLETLIISLYAAEHVDYLRIHNVHAHTRAFKVATFMTSATV